MADIERIALWPGPLHLLPLYSDGWDAYSAFYLGWQNENRAQFGDPEEHAPSDLDEGERSVWCMGWLEAMTANNAINSARVAGVADDVALWRIANSEVSAIRATYLSGWKDDRVH